MPRSRPGPRPPSLRRPSPSRPSAARLHPIVAKIRDDTHIVELDLVGGEDAGLPVRLAVVMLHDRPF